MKRKVTTALLNNSKTESSDGMADIDRILKEKGKGLKKQYLCSWMDGAEPQWVACEYLIDTEALDEWNDAEDEVPEEYDTESVINEKCATLVDLMRISKRTSFLVGAGLSAPVLPTFRGKGGLWTRNAGASSKKGKNVNSSNQTTSKPVATLAHRALAALEQKGHVNWIASQNYDDLFTSVGFPSNKLSELHGNIYKETCTRCGAEYHRDFEVELSTSTNHETGRLCERNGCDGMLKDNIVHFGESLPWKDLTLANAKFLSADLSIVLGSSLRVEPAASLPFKAKRRVKKGSEKEKTLKSVIVNLQPTPRDVECDLIIRAKCDDVLNRIACELLGADWDVVCCDL